MTPEQKWNYLRAKMKLKGDRKRKQTKKPNKTNKQKTRGLWLTGRVTQHTTYSRIKMSLWNTIPCAMNIYKELFNL